MKRITRRCDNPPMLYDFQGGYGTVDNHSFFVLLYFTIKHDLLRRKSMRMDELRSLVNVYKLITNQYSGANYYGSKNGEWFTQVKSEYAQIINPAVLPCIDKRLITLKLDINISSESIVDLWLVINQKETINLNQEQNLPLLLETLVTMYRNVLYGVKFDS